jgi:hypothetical protein
MLTIVAVFFWWYNFLKQVVKTNKQVLLFQVIKQPPSAFSSGLDCNKEGDEKYLAEPLSVLLLPLLPLHCPLPAGFWLSEELLPLHCPLPAGFWLSEELLPLHCPLPAGFWLSEENIVCVNLKPT